ncbi:MAG TPA: hypothetical protein VEU08_07515, partial [Vicinamibacterales bacterium]|nr:hypothetical protein [Vicinamibacterales bacterium]
MGPVILAVVFLYASLSAQGTDVGLNGTWTLNKTLSEFPPEPGFTADWVTAASAPDGASGGGGRGGGGRGGRRGGGGGSAGPAGITPVRESAEDAARIRLFNAELRNPAASLKIVETADAVTITDAGGSRTLHPNDRAEALSATDSKLPDIIVTAQREGAALVVTYNVEANRQLKYIYSAGGSPRQLTVDAEIHERKNVTRVHRVYDQGTAAETAPPPGAGAPAAASPPAGASGSGGRGPGSSSEKFDQRPDAELRGLNVVGLVVEELSPQASACGLNHDTIDNEV